MKKRTVFRLFTLMLALLMLVGAMGGCSAKQKVLLELDGHTFSSNMYTLLLSRVKGTFEYGGYNVESDSFWDTVIDLEKGTTYDEYVRQMALLDAKKYLAATVMFDEEGLTLPESAYEEIDQDIDDYIVGDAGGSKSEMNAILTEFGVNINILKELYTIEAKYAYLQQYLYGANGEKIGGNVKQEYLENNAVCFRQILIRSYYYVYETDDNKDEIYYVKDSNNGKTNNIAYDTKAGTTRIDEYGKIIKDKNDEPVYFKPDGKIAYDKENGVRAYTYDDDGYPISKKYDQEQLDKNLDLAKELVAEVSNGDYAEFESLLAEYESSGLDEIMADSEFCFLYTTGDNNSDYLNDIADVLADSEVGDISYITSDYGYNVVMKYPMPEGAYSDDDYTEWFTDFNSRVSSYLFAKKCTERAKDILVDNDVFASVPSMKEIGINHYY